MANRIGHYELIAELGSGAMGKVYRTRDTRLDREAALKVLWRAGAAGRKKAGR